MIPLYEAVSENRKYGRTVGTLAAAVLRDGSETLFDYVPEAVVTLTIRWSRRISSASKQADDLYQARRMMLEAEQGKKIGRGRWPPIAPCRWICCIFRSRNGKYGCGRIDVYDLSPFSPSPGQKDGGGRKGRDFGDVRAQSGSDIRRD